MNNIVMINNQKAIISYDPDTEMFRGEFIGLNGGADFYGTDIESLKAEGAISLQTFLDMCKENDINPYKHYSGRFNVRIDPKLHEQAMATALSQGVSLNEFVSKAIDQVARQY